MAKKVFISFDYDHDLEIKEALVAQSKNPNSPFTIVDMSIKEAIDTKWKQYARNRMQKCDLMIVLCGLYTDSASGVAAELSIAQEIGLSYFLLWGRAKGRVVKPANALKEDKIYNWTWDNLHALIGGNR